VFNLYRHAEKLPAHPARRHHCVHATVVDVQFQPCAAIPGDLDSGLEHANRRKEGDRHARLTQTTKAKTINGLGFSVFPIADPDCVQVLRWLLSGARDTG
jgi:hypothetical protein